MWIAAAVAVLTALAVVASLLAFERPTIAVLGSVLVGVSLQLIWFEVLRRQSIDSLAQLERGLDRIAAGQPGELAAPHTLGPWASLALATTKIERRLIAADSHAHVFRLDRDQHRVRLTASLQRLLAELSTSATCAAAMAELVLGSVLTADQRRYLECARAALDTQLDTLHRERRRLRGGTLDEETVDVRRCVEQVVEFYADRASHLGCPLLLAFGSMPTRDVVLDVAAFRQALFGLLRQAIEAAIGPIRIEVAFRHDTSPQQIGVRIQVTATDDAHQLTQRALAKSSRQPSRGAFDALPTSFDLGTAARLLSRMGGRLELDRGVLDKTTTFHLLVPTGRRRITAANEPTYALADEPLTSASTTELGRPAPAANDAGPGAATTRRDEPAA